MRSRLPFRRLRRPLPADVRFTAIEPGRFAGWPGPGYVKIARTLAAEETAWGVTRFV